eukprot:12172705-Ditylum_brightwellii.AAC.1
MVRLVQLLTAAAIAQRNLCLSALLPCCDCRHLAARYPGTRKTTTIMATAAPIGRHLVLVGGRHAHVQVLKALHKSVCLANTLVTLVDAQCNALYSRMAPRVVVDIDLDRKQLIVKMQIEGILEIGFNVVSFDIISDLVQKIQDAEGTLVTKKVPMPMPLWTSFAHGTFFARVRKREEKNQIVQ